ncbi:MAG TPA: nitronate monooxygenase, partial [Anaeromyxobacteraceae bacterium]|nr:nitronate monooxygenase [Anaeromyxobacteraceae bacterium]
MRVTLRGPGAELGGRARQLRAAASLATSCRMWPRLVSQRLGIDYPLIVAPMAGGPSTPDLVAAVSEAGALGSFGAGYLQPEAIRAAIREIRARTARPFAVNLFVPEVGPPPGEEAVAAAIAALEPIRRELKVPREIGLLGSS